MENRIEELISFIKNEMERMGLDAEKVFLNGNCGNLYNIFAMEFEGAEPWVIMYRGNPYHIVTKLNNQFYDITGKTNINEYIKYMKENNTQKFDENKFEIKKDESGIAKQMENKFMYNEDFDQSEIYNEMCNLYNKIRSRKNKEQCEKNEEER